MDETEILQEIRGDKIEYKKYLCRRNLRTKYKVMRAYGGKCVCCGESTLSFLTIDHPNNDGVKDRLAHGVGSTFYRWLKKGGYPEGYRVLCFNCNCGRQINGGECPHEEQRRVDKLRGK